MKWVPMRKLFFQSGLINLRFLKFNVILHLLILVSLKLKYLLAILSSVMDLFFFLINCKRDNFLSVEKPGFSLRIVFFGSSFGQICLIRFSSFPLIGRSRFTLLISLVYRSLVIVIVSK